MPIYPDVHAGQRVTADILRAMIPEQVTKSTTETVTSSTTLQNDDELFLSAVANATYEVEMWLLHSSGTTGRFKGGWTVPASSTFAWGVHGAASTATTSPATDVLMQIRTSVENISLGGANLSGTAAYIRGTLITAGTAGTLQFQFAQVTSDAAATQVRNGSVLKIKRTA
ncbi:hypothetical protein ACFWP7_28810 [Streptomyces sp. NPDC058470]|uniref:hypothetical protein n=1 Tax=Streptomyces sp. NPDC058470 TaxID=3346515 RepID=UPI003652BD71